MKNKKLLFLVVAILNLVGGLLGVLISAKELNLLSFQLPFMSFLPETSNYILSTLHLFSAILALISVVPLAKAKREGLVFMCVSNILGFVVHVIIFMPLGILVSLVSFIYIVLSRKYYK